MADIIDTNVRTNNAYLKALIGECKWDTERSKTTYLNVFFSDEGTMGKWSPWEIEAFKNVFENIESVIGFKFKIVDKESDADITEYRQKHDFFDHGDSSTTLGKHNFPGSGDEGHFNVDSGTAGWSAGSVSSGGFSFEIILHEMLHAIGLAHPHDTGHGTSLWPGASGPFSTGLYGDNTTLGTAMSYNADPVASLGATQFYGNIIGPMAYDIAALQAMYGANETYNADDTLYYLPSVNDIGTGWKAIWDAGGDSDWILNPISAGSVIDLNAATLDGGLAGAGMPSFIKGIVGGFTIANGVIIENAQGNNGDDVIAGNQVGNTLKGLEGIDQIDGRGGDDKIFGDAGDDFLKGGRGSDHIYGGKNNDTLVGNGEGDDFYGETDHLYGGQGDDDLFGDGGDDFLYGGTGTDSFNGGWGNDTIYADREDAFDHNWLDGGDGFDTVIVNTSQSVAYELNGTNVEKVVGNKGDDILNGTDVTVGLVLDGGLGNDTLIGGDAGDTLIGGYGKNTLIGGAGHDYLIGGENADTFVFGSGFGLNEIFNFQSGTDQIDISAMWNDDSDADFGDVQIRDLGVNWANSTQEYQVKVDDVTILVHGMSVGEQLTESDFVLI